MEKGPGNANQIVTIFFIRPRGGNLGFQNGRHFQHISAYNFNFWAPEGAQNGGKPKSMMLKDIIKALGRLLVAVILVAILNFKMAAI